MRCWWWWWQWQWWWWWWCWQWLRWQWPPVLPASIPWWAPRRHWRGKNKLRSRPIASERCSDWIPPRLAQLKTWKLEFYHLELDILYFCNWDFCIFERSHLSGKMSDRGSSFSRTATRDSFVSDMEKQPRHRHSNFLTYICIFVFLYFGIFAYLYFCIFVFFAICLN